MESSQDNQSVNRSSDAKSSPFDLLPDEMVLKIIKMAADGFGNKRQKLCHSRPNFQLDCRHTFHMHQLKYEFLINTVSKVSRRFKRIATDKTLWANWNGEVAINGSRNKDLWELLGNYVKKIKSLTPSANISAKALKTMADKCPKLEELYLRGFRISSLPSSCNFASLKMLSISFGNLFFKDVQLHMFAPNIEVIEFYGLSLWENLLPDMSRCERLLEVYLNGAGSVYTFPGRIPFPRGLRKLSGDSFGLPTLIQWDRESLKRYLEDCYITHRIGFTKRKRAIMNPRQL